ncbi:MAG: hypothetical protein HQK50_00125 [Oligoflexia bacterium]|nr:hypothetical protein [Oligoflexia bacterium]MBF0363940.1 hypothetical protein [Oligoflexia bacterium]
MPLRNKYPITDWVLSKECVIKGDVVAFFCEEEKQEVHAEVLGFPSEEHRQYVSCRRLGTEYTEVINFYSTIVYKIKDAVTASRACTCGARHTSNPRFHLSYCDLAS